MKLVFFTGAAAILGTGFYIHNPFSASNVYAMPADQVYEKLSKVQVQPSGTGPFGRLDVSTSGTRPKSVTWSASGSHAAVQCTAMIQAKSEKSTWLNVSCDGGGAGNGAANGMFIGMIRKAVIELVDSTLDERDYDSRKAQGETAYGWPADPVHHASFGEAVGDAMKMDAEMRRMRQEEDARRGN